MNRLTKLPSPMRCKRHRATTPTMWQLRPRPIKWPPMPLPRSPTHRCLRIHRQSSQVLSLTWTTATRPTPAKLAPMGLTPKSAAPTPSLTSTTSAPTTTTATLPHRIPMVGRPVEKLQDPSLAPSSACSSGSSCVSESDAEDT